jgi:hypothetical protein
MKKTRAIIYSLFRDTESQPGKADDTEVQQPMRMSFEERKAYRKTMLTRSLQKTLLSMGVDGGMYALSVVHTDARHHRFAVMVDTARSFLAVNVARTMRFAEVEAIMRTNIYNRFGILGVSMYWRIGDHETGTDSDSICDVIVPPVDAQANHIRTHSLQAPAFSPDMHRAQTDDESTEHDEGIMRGGTLYGRL